MRTSAYKEKILNILSGLHLATIADIHARLPDADFSTIFRNVEQLVEGGQIKQVVIDKGTVMYESSAHTHDHFVCTSCKDVSAVDLSKTVSKALGSAVLSDVVVRGLCHDCTDTHNS